MISAALLAICCLTIAIDVLLIYRWSFHKKEPNLPPAQPPFVSVLIAARNEEHTLKSCLNHLLQVEYPRDKLEILIGDDNSEDQTYAIAEEFSKAHDFITVVSVKENMGLAKGKANVLAHLAKEAKGEIYFITDADITVPPTWIKFLLAGIVNKRVAIVNGITSVRHNVWQNIDWLFALGMVKVIHDMGHPVTAMGNNMLVTREAYEAVGGYESIPFSITEDFELFKQVRKKKYEVIQMTGNEVMAETEPERNFIDLLSQRKRWMRGAIQLPWQVVTLLFIQAVYFPALIGLMIVDMSSALIILGAKLLIQSTFILMVSSHLTIKIPFYKTLLYEAYSVVVSVGTSLYYLLPLKISWKGRKY